MKLNLSSLIKFIPKTSRDVRGVRQFVNPSREWGMSLLVTLIVASVLIAHAGIEFYRQYTDVDKPVVSEEHIPRYREGDAELLIRYYERREEEFNTLQNTHSPEVVPIEEEVVEVETVTNVPEPAPVGTELQFE